LSKETKSYQGIKGNKKINKRKTERIKLNQQIRGTQLFNNNKPVRWKTPVVLAENFASLVLQKWMCKRIKKTLCNFVQQ